jgi:hypothetical protein
VREIVLAKRDLDLHSRIGVVAEDLDHAAHRLRVLCRLLEDFRDNHLPRLRATEVLGGNEDVLADALVLGDDEGHLVLEEEAPHNLVVRALEHFDDRSLEPPAAIDAGHAREHDVAVQHLLHLLLREEEIVLSIVGLEEPVAIGMTDHLAANEARLVGDEDRATAVAHDLPLALHRGETARKAFPLRVVDLEALGELVFIERHPRVAEFLEHRLAARNFDRVGEFWAVAPCFLTVAPAQAGAQFFGFTI